MKFYAAGGCQEHGRNCFYVEGESATFLVDCGILQAEPPLFPLLSADQARRSQILFLTHSHEDHAGGLMWLVGKEFTGLAVLSRETFRQLPVKPLRWMFTEDLGPAGSWCSLDSGLRFAWGRSGHCAGAVWYCIDVEGRNMFFSGDYIVDSPLYYCDQPKNLQARLAVLDCGRSCEALTSRQLRQDVVREVKNCVNLGQRVLLPTPRYGRGLEMLLLLTWAGLHCQVDEKLWEQLQSEERTMEWYRADGWKALKKAVAECLVQLAPESGGEPKRITHDSKTRSAAIFVTDPQLRRQTSRELSRKVLAEGGAVILTGHTQYGSFSEALLATKQASQLKYPVHQNLQEMERLAGQNQFETVVPFHSHTKINVYDFQTGEAVEF